MAHSPPIRPSDPKLTRLDALLARQSSLQATITTLTAERNSLVCNTLNKTTFSDPQEPTANPSETAITTALEQANKKIKAHIDQLQQYNEIKDIGTQLMGMIAEKRGCRIVEVQEEFDVDEND